MNDQSEIIIRLKYCIYKCSLVTCNSNDLKTSFSYDPIPGEPP